MGKSGVTGYLSSETNKLSIIMKNKKVSGMNRWDLITELRKYSHPAWYQKVILAPTESLRALVAHYHKPTRRGIADSGICIVR